MIHVPEEREMPLSGPHYRRNQVEADDLSVGDHYDRLQELRNQGKIGQRS
jgi:hypothetical protein